MTLPFVFFFSFLAIFYGEGFNTYGLCNSFFFSWPQIAFEIHFKHQNRNFKDNIKLKVYANVYMK
jgi:hypothetical protein